MKRITVILLLLVASCFGQGLTLRSPLRDISPVASVSLYDPATDTNVVEWLRSYEAGNTISNWVAYVGISATQNTASAKPTLPAAVQNGNAAYLFDGDDDSMRTFKFNSGVTPPYEIYFAFNALAQSDFLAGFWVDDTANEIFALNLTLQAGGPFARDCWFNETNKWFIGMVRYADLFTAVAGYQTNGGSFTLFSGDTGPNTMTNVVFGDYASYGGHMYLGEWGIVAGTSSVATVTSRFQYLNNKWNAY